MTKPLDQFIPPQRASLRRDVSPRALTLKRFVLYTAATLAALVLALMLYVGWIVHQPRGKPGKYAAQLEALVREGQTVAGPNGFDVLRELIAAVDAAEAVTLAKLGGPVLPHGIDYGSIYDSAEAELHNPDREQREQHLKAALACFDAVMQGPAPALMDKLTAATWAATQIPTHLPIFLAGVNELRSARRVARICLARFHVAAEQNDTAAALASVRSALAGLRHGGHQYLIINRLDAMDMGVLIYERVRAIALSAPRDPALLAGLMAAVRAAPGADIAKNVRGERLSVLDTIEVSHTDGGSGDGVLFYNSSDFAGPLVERGSSPALGLLFARKRASTAKANEYFDLVDAAATAPTFAAAAVNFDRMIKFANSLGRHYVLLKMVLPADGRLVNSRFAFITERNATLCLLAVEIAEQQTGTLPASLESLTTPRCEFPALLSPADLLDPCSGKPLVYRVGKPFEQSSAAASASATPASPPRSRRYVLYSVGADGVDDGGAMPANKNDRRQVLTTVTPGYDRDFAADE